MKTINYFGTKLDHAGHYFWTLYEEEKYDGFYSSEYGDYKPKCLDIHPDYFNTNGKSIGDVIYATVSGMNIICIIGSPYDKRGGCKSVFWDVKETSFEDLKSKILSYPTSKKILENLNKKINW